MNFISKAYAVTTNIQNAINKDTVNRGLLGRFFKFENIGQMITNIVDISLSISAILVFVFIIWGAIDLISSQGDKQQYEGARNKITYAVVGLTIVALAWAAWWLILKFFGVGVLTPGDSANVKFILP